MLGVVPNDASGWLCNNANSSCASTTPHSDAAHRMVQDTLRKRDADKFSRQKDRQKENSLLAQGQSLPDCLAQSPCPGM